MVNPLIGLYGQIRVGFLKIDIAAQNDIVTGFDHQAGVFIQGGQGTREQEAVR